VVSHKLTRLTVKGHDTANYERVQLQWILTSELVRLSHFGVLFTMTMWTCIVLLVRWPWAQQVANRVQLCRGWIVIGHLAPAARGLTEVLGWYLLVVQLVVPGRASLGALLEWVVLGMVLRVQAGSVASGVVALTALLARLVCTLVAAGVWPESGERGQEGCHLWFEVVS